jgi:formylglycine-generating enzyme required for sulfatase activity
MGTREITNKEFREYLSTHNSGAFKTQTLNRSDQPVAQVTWKQAAFFCNWLSKKEGLSPAYTQKGENIVATEPLTTGYRLPTEAEWEYCARFAHSGAPLKYPWGNHYPPTNKTVNIADVSAKDILSATLDRYNDGYPVSSPSGGFSSNDLGLYDLGGNVAEWCHDYYSIISYSTQKAYLDPTGPKEGKHRIVRGSSWRHAGISALRSAYRDYSNGKRADLGFRICRYAR